MTVLYVTHPQFLDHDTGHRAPRAARSGWSAVEEGVAPLGPRRRPDPGARPSRRRRPSSSGCTRRPTSARSSAFCRTGGGRLDADTVGGARVVGRRPAGRRRRARPPSTRCGGARPTPRSARCARRATTRCPPRPWGSACSTTWRSTAAALADAGERVLIVDYDAHHGNGTQDTFYDDPRVLVRVVPRVRRCIRAPARCCETGGGDGRGRTVNVPVPPGATGDVYRGRDRRGRRAARRRDRRRPGC